MSFKKTAVEALYRAANQELGPARSVIKECAELIEGLPDEERENIPCAMPNYEAMYHEAMEKLQNSEFVQESMRNEIQQLHFANARLTGFQEAVELVFKKDCNCHGHC